MRRRPWKTGIAIGIVSICLAFSACGKAGSTDGTIISESESASEQTAGRSENESTVNRSTEADTITADTTEAGRAETAKNADGTESRNPKTDTGASVWEIKAAANIGIDSALLSEKFLKAGDINTSAYLYAETGNGDDKEGTSSNSLNLFLDYSDENQSGMYASADIETKSGTNTYDGLLEINQYGNITEKSSKTEENVKISFSENAFTIAGGTFAGMYEPQSVYGTYPSGTYWLAEQFATRAELGWMDNETLALLRNSIYAMHGRKFSDEELQAYFGSKVWYRGNIEPKQFSDKILSDIERTNAALIATLEKEAPGTRTGTAYRGPEGIEPAPYISYLDQFSETGLWADMATAKDVGAYWEVSGEISQPVTMTREQWEKAANGEPVAIIIDEVTGETKTARCKGNTWALSHDGETPSDDQYDNSVSFDFKNNLYYFWRDSDDTIMKPVYQGEIRIAKGAVYGGDVGLPMASRGQKDVSADAGEISGNWILHDGKGTILAVYYLGD